MVSLSAIFARKKCTGPRWCN